MKNLWTKLSVLAALFAVAGCADGNSEDENQPETCTANVCKDASTLVLCSQGISNELTCTYGCENGACKPMNQPAGCTVSICKDASTLLACNGGVQNEVPCSFGCEAGACKAPTQNEQCSISVCQNSDVLLACNAGVQSIVPCPFGCENGVCKAACSTDVCKDAATLLMCDNGKTSEVDCALGCNAGKCNAACSADFCRDSQILMHCENGNIKPIDCPYGCNAGVCNTNVPVTNVCDNGTKQCDANGNAQECVNNQWVTTPCSNGCTAGTCNAAQTCTSGARQCDANGNAQVCVSNSWQTIPCSNGCSNGNCNAAPTCANGATQCDTNGNVQICQNNSWQTTPCAKGCKNGACIVCYDNETQCAADGKTIQTCSANAWKNSQVCSVACSAGVCVNDTSCVAGAKRCNGNAQQICTNNQWVNATVCDYACENGECKAAPSVCTNGQKQCNGNDLQTCNNGQWVTTTCPNGCENNACKDAPAVCSNGTKQCNGVYVQTCTNGQWVQAATPCANGCSNGACTNAPAACTGNEKKCSGSSLMTCSNGQWVTTACANGCDSVNLVCKSSGNLPTVGDSCNESFYDVCDGDTIYYCGTSAKVTTANCAQMNATCRTSSTSFTDCVELCPASQNGKTSGYYCYYYSDYDKYVAYPVVCSATTNGDYAEFIDNNNYEECDGNCNETEGCTDSAYFYCGDKTTGGQTLESICKASSSTNVAVCTTDATGTYYECAQSCSTVGQTGTACTEFSEGSFSYNTICTQVGDYKVMLDASTSIDDYTECTSGACNAAGTACAGGSAPACTNGAKQCSGNNLQTCSNGQWVTTTCPNGCANGACKSSGGNNEGSSTHTLGASCTSAEYGERGCDGNTLVICDGSSYINMLSGSYTCKDYGSNYYCDEQAAYGFADCVQTCDAEDEGYIVNFDSECDSTYNDFEFFVCEEGDSGKLGSFGGYYAVSLCSDTNSKIACNSNSVVATQTCNSCADGRNADNEYEATCH